MSEGGGGRRVLFTVGDTEAEERADEEADEKEEMLDVEEATVAKEDEAKN